MHSWKCIYRDPSWYFMQQFFVYLPASLWWIMDMVSVNPLHRKEPKLWSGLVACHPVYQASGKSVDTFLSPSRSFPTLMPLQGQRFPCLEIYNPACSYTPVFLILVISKLLLRTSQNLQCCFTIYRATPEQWKPNCQRTCSSLCLILYLKVLRTSISF